MAEDAVLVAIQNAPTDETAMEAEQGALIDGTNGLSPDDPDEQPG